jgi:DNA-directed RNA polymerase subunit alpha
MLEFCRPQIKVESTNEVSARFVVEPLERGFGYTLGNCIRRVLLSSLPGAAITSVRIDNVNHEFSTIDGVYEDVTDIILNLKSLVFKVESDGEYVAKLQVKGPKDVKGKDIKCPAGVECVSLDTHIAKLRKSAKLEMEMVVSSGRGYVSAEWNKKPDAPIGVIPIDSIFTPVTKVSYRVGNTRVGQRTDYDKLELDVTTNGSLTPHQAISIAGQIINDHMELFMNQSDTEVEQNIFAEDKVETDVLLNSPIEDLELSVRSYNCLKRQGIHTLDKLAECSEMDLMNIRNFGAKSIQEVKDKLREIGLSLKS